MTASLARGEVHWVELDPVRGSEMAKTRPCVVLSANEINRRRRTIVIVPLTSTAQAASFPLLIEVPSAGTVSKVRPEQIRCIDRSRLRGLAGRLSEEDMHNISLAIGAVLHLRRF